MRFLEFYYKMWGEALNAGKKNKHSFFSDDYKFLGLFYMSMLDSLWILTIDTLLWYFDLSISKALSLSQDKIVGGLQLMLITVGPFLVLNYFLIFYKGKYKRLMEKYNTGSKKFLAAIIFIPTIIFLLAIYSHLIVEIITGNAYLGM